MKDARKIYAIGHAGWYNFFKNLWNRFVVSKAENQLTLFLQNNLNKDKIILDLGCGTALNLQKIKSLNLKFKRYLGLDFSPDMLEIARQKFMDIPNVEFREKDITKLYNLKGKFDVIICTWVLSHLQSPSDVVNKAQKMLKKDGKIFFIFFSQPKWYIRFWFGPLAKYFFKAEYVKNEEIKKFKNVRKRQNFSAGIATIVEIYR